MSNDIDIRLRVNGRLFDAKAESRLLLSDFLRHTLRLTGTHVGCEHGVCGACTVLVNGEAIRSCLMFAVQARGAEIMTIEGLTENPSDGFQALQTAFRACHAVQCGYCTPGLLISIYAYLRDHPNSSAVSNDEIRIALSGNICRCTGYQNIVEAVRTAASALETSKDKY